MVECITGVMFVVKNGVKMPETFSTSELMEALESLNRRVSELENLIAEKQVRNSLAETLRTIADELEDEDDDLVPSKKTDPRDDNLVEDLDE